MSEQTGSCFMCKQAGQGGCLECRTSRLLADIRMTLYERLGAEQNRSEWEERALEAEGELKQSQAELAAAHKALVMAAIPLEACYMAGSLTSDEGLREVKAAVLAIRAALSQPAASKTEEAA